MYSLLVSVGVGVLVAGIAVAELEERYTIAINSIESLWYLIHMSFVYYISFENM